MDKFEKFIKREKIYEGKIIKVYKDKIKIKNNKIITREIVKHDECVAILAIKNKKIVFVRQNRYAISASSLEIPAGILNSNENAEKGALRELHEETGLIAKEIKFLFKFYSSIGFCDELINLFIAQDFIQDKQNLDDDEFISLEEYDYRQAIELISKNKIFDAKTIIAILTYKNYIKNT
ncbi:MAG: NUDIX hydrolase [Clostridiales bacterium]|jgi:ADP-ribose pyrophosphatase|nr:NUDIX hydrolase [Clostridiales bacterium]